MKEVWKEKAEEMRSGRTSELADFVFAHLQKKVGIVSTVVEVRPPVMTVRIMQNQHC